MIFWEKKKKYPRCANCGETEWIARWDEWKERCFRCGSYNIEEEK